MTLAPEGIALAGTDGAPIETWPYRSVVLRAEELRKGPVRLARGDARLTVGDPAFAAALHRAAPHLRLAIRRTLFYGTAATVLLLAAVGGFWWGIPRIAAKIVEHIPPAWEETLGANAEVEAWWGGRCTGAAGQTALDTLTRRLMKGVQSPYPLHVSVRDSEMVNAFAFPGGHVVLLRGLLKEAETPDEVAGVLAHELTHTLRRHPMRALVANSGVALLFEVTVGNGTGASIGALLTTLSYTRAMEAEADDGAVGLLHGAGIGTDGFAAFFQRMVKRHHDLPAFISTHPPDEARLEAIKAQASQGTIPALSPGEWQALKDICAQHSGG